MCIYIYEYVYIYICILAEREREGDTYISPYMLQTFTIAMAMAISSSKCDGFPPFPAFGASKLGFKGTTYPKSTGGIEPDVPTFRHQKLNTYLDVFPVENRGFYCTSQLALHPHQLCLIEGTSSDSIPFSSWAISETKLHKKRVAPCFTRPLFLKDYVYMCICVYIDGAS